MSAMILTICIALTTVAIGYRVWRSNRQQISYQLFFCLAILMSLWIIFNHCSKSVDDEELFLLFVRLVMVVTDLIPPVLYLFSLSFPHQPLALSRRTYYSLLVWSFFITELNLTSYVFPSAHIVDHNWLPQAGWGIVFVIINMVVLLSLAIINFFRQSRVATGVAKLRLTYLALSSAAALVIAFIFNFILPLVYHDSQFMSLGIGAMSLILVGVVGYSMMRASFVGIDLLLARVIYYFVLVFWLLLPLLSFYFFPPQLNFFYLSLSLPVYFLWVWVLAHIYNHLNDFLIRQIVNHGADWYHEREQFFATIAKETDYRNILAQTSDFFSLFIKNSGNLVVGDFLENESVVARGDLQLKITPAALLAQCLTAWSQPPFTPLILEDISTAWQPALKKTATMMRKNNLAVVFPLVVYGDIKGLVAMTPKTNDHPYFIQDIDLVTQTLAEVTPILSQASVYQASRNFNNFLQRKIDRATRKLQKMNQKLIIADKLKDEFVSVASHELRTPMTAIKGYLWLVYKNNTPANLKNNQKYIKVAMDSTDRLLALVNDMLTISRIEGDQFALNLEIIDARILTTQIQQELLPVAQQKKLKLQVKNPVSPRYIHADSKRVLEVLHNLVGNALKFTAQGSVTLVTRSDKQWVYIDVIDTGTGIDSQDFDKLFSKFARLEKSYVKIKETGTGLGLYISRQIMHKHQGDVSFSSRLGHGSTFTIFFPKVAGRH